MAIYLGEQTREEGNHIVTKRDAQKKLIWQMHSANERKPDRPPSGSPWRHVFPATFLTWSQHYLMGMNRGRESNQHPNIHAQSASTSRQLPHALELTVTIFAGSASVSESGRP